MGAVVAVLYAYLLAGIPVGFVALAGKASPLYRKPVGWYLSCWSWMALGFIVSAVLLYRVIPTIA